MKPGDKKRLQKFREKLVQIRTARGLSQRALANACDIDHTKISRLENDPDTNLNLTTLFELARGLEVHPNDLLNYDVDWEIKKIT